MNQQEILEYNERCAEFLGWSYGHPDRLETRWSTDWFDNNGYRHSYLHFDSDWNWIHEVINGIKNTTNPKSNSDTTFSTLRGDIKKRLGTSHKEATIQAINQFLIWYKQNQK